MTKYKYLQISWLDFLTLFTVRVMPVGLPLFDDASELILGLEVLLQISGEDGLLYRVHDLPVVLWLQHLGGAYNMLRSVSKLGQY